MTTCMMAATVEKEEALLQDILALDLRRKSNSSSPFFDWVLEAEESQCPSSSRDEPRVHANRRRETQGSSELLHAYTYVKRLTHREH